MIQLDLLLRKGVYPYDYMDSFDKFDEKKLPPKDEFYSKLKDEKITDEDYKHAKKVWKKFKIKNMGEYHDLYLETDVLLLSDVFENFRKICIKNYDLDPCWYYTAPGLSWDALLKQSKIELELLSDVDMLLFFENAIRGGVSMISNRYGKANNKYMKEYNKSKPTKYLTYLDANNLYGWAMSQPLPINNFEWMNKKELKELDTNKFETNQEIGYMLEVDLEYPHELHDLHNDYPLAPEKNNSK